MYYLACGYIGGVNSFLGHPIWTPLARLSFGAYLFHIIFLVRSMPLLVWVFG